MKKKFVSALLLSFAISAFVLLNPLNFHIFLSGNSKLIVDPWVQFENTSANFAFGDVLPESLQNEADNTLSRRRVLSPFIDTNGGDIDVLYAERYAFCHEYYPKETGRALPLRTAQGFDGERCRYDVDFIRVDTKRKVYSALLSDTYRQKPHILIKMRRDGGQVLIEQQREFWIKQHFLTTDGQLWYARYEDKDSFSPDPCLLWEMMHDTDRCVMWSHALNSLPAFEKIRFFPGRTADNLWLVLSGKKTNRLYTAIKDPVRQQWVFSDTQVRGVIDAASLGDSLFYEQAQDETNVPHARYQPRTLWKITEEGIAEKVLGETVQQNIWSTRNGILQVVFQSMPGFPARLMFWKDNVLQDVSLNEVHKTAQFIGFGNDARVISYNDVKGQYFIDHRDGDVWRHRAISIYPEGVRMQTMAATSADGSSVNCLVLDKLSGRPAKATMISVYGAYGMSNFPTPDIETNILLTAGVRMIFPQTRGGGGGGVKWAHAGRGAGKARIVEDAEACMQEVVRQGLAESGKIISRGGSAGAIPAYWLLQRNPGMVAGAILERPYLAMQMQRGIINEVEFGSLAQQASRKVIDELNPYESMLAGQLQHGKVLFLCGGEDINTPDWHCRASQTALRLRGHRQSWMYIAEHSDHYGLPPLHPETQTELRLLVNFVQKAGEQQTLKSTVLH